VISAKLIYSFNDVLNCFWNQQNQSLIAKSFQLIFLVACIDVKARVLESRGSKPSSQPGTPRASEMKELLTKFETAQNEEDGCTQETNPSLGEFW
jgi:shikimate kinase